MESHRACRVKIYEWFDRAVEGAFRVPHLQAEAVLRRMALRLDTYDIDELYLLEHYFGLTIEHPKRFCWVEFSLARHRQRAIDSAPTKKPRLARSLEFFASRRNRSREGLPEPKEETTHGHWWENQQQRQPKDYPDEDES